jgi:hypothetical protein
MRIVRQESKHSQLGNRLLPKFHLMPNHPIATTIAGPLNPPMLGDFEAAPVRESPSIGGLGGGSAGYVVSISRFGIRQNRSPIFMPRGRSRVPSVGLKIPTTVSSELKLTCSSKACHSFLPQTVAKIRALIFQGNLCTHLVCKCFSSSLGWRTN